MCQRDRPGLFGVSLGAAPGSAGRDVVGWRNVLASSRLGPSTVNNPWRRCRGSWGWLGNGRNDGYRLVEVRGPLWARHRSGSDGSTVAVSDQRRLRIPIGRMSTGRGRSCGRARPLRRARPGALGLARRCCGRWPGRRPARRDPAAPAGRADGRGQPQRAGLLNCRDNASRATTLQLANEPHHRSDQLRLSNQSPEPLVTK
jgi:hypothetical protein